MTNKTTLLFLLVAGCGGTAAKYTVDDVALAQVPTAEKKPIFDAQQAVSVAQSEKVKAEADRDGVKHDIDLASAERDQAKLETVKAKMSGDSAEKSHDQNKILAAQRELKAAQLGEEAAEAKVDYLNTVKKWHGAIVDAAEDDLAVANARVEMEKANLAVAKGIKPAKDFNPEVFKNDVAKREKQAQEDRRRAAELKAEADKAKKAYDDMQAQIAQLKSAPR